MQVHSFRVSVDKQRRAISSDGEIITILWPVGLDRMLFTREVSTKQTCRDFTQFVVLKTVVADWEDVYYIVSRKKCAFY